MSDADRYRILREAMLRGIPPDPPIKRFMNDMRALFAADATRYRKVHVPAQRTIGPTPTKGYSSGHPVVEPSAAQKVGKFVAEMAPGSGEGIAAAEAIKQAGKGNWGRAAFAGIGAIPAIGSVAKAPKAIRRGIQAWHGSPHKFDRFDLSKIGTGEGAQVYGHGLYFAESPDVARFYRETLSGRIPAGATKPSDSAHIAAAANFIENGYSPEQTLAELKRAYRDASEADLQVAIHAANKGHLYRVNLDVDEEELLDWDSEIGRQGHTVQSRLASSGLLNETGWLGKNRTGEEYYTNLTERMASPHKASDVLRSAGVPGLRYLDAASRRRAAGTRNFVMFDDNRVKILETLAIMGMLGGAGAASGREQP